MFPHELASERFFLLCDGLRGLQPTVVREDGSVQVQQVLLLKWLILRLEIFLVHHFFVKFIIIILYVHTQTVLRSKIVQEVSNAGYRRNPGDLRPIHISDQKDLAYVVAEHQHKHDAQTGN